MITRTPSAENARANALLAFSKSFKKIKRAKTMANHDHRKRRKRRRKKLKRRKSAPEIRSVIKEELIWAFIHDIDLSQPGCQRIQDSLEAQGMGDKLSVTSYDRKRSSSLVPYGEKEKKKAPDKETLLKTKRIPLAEIYRKVAKFIQI